jgi:hypothetical protein
MPVNCGLVVWTVLLLFTNPTISVAAASEADDRLRECLVALVEIAKRQRTLPDGSGCRESRKRIAEMVRIDADLKRTLRQLCAPRRISGGEISMADADKLVATWNENGKSFATLLRTERRLQSAICR